MAASSVPISHPTGDSQGGNKKGNIINNIIIVPSKAGVRRDREEEVRTGDQTSPDAKLHKLISSERWSGRRDHVGPITGPTSQHSHPEESLGLTLCVCCNAALQLEGNH